MFLAVYARVSSGGRISCGDAVTDLGPGGRNPFDDLPQGTPTPRQWPRIVELRVRADKTIVLAGTNPAWPLPAASPGSSVRIHPGLAGIASPSAVALLDSGAAGYTVARSDALAGLDEGTRLILTGPYGPKP